MNIKEYVDDKITIKLQCNMQFAHTVKRIFLLRFFETKNSTMRCFDTTA